MHPDPWLERWRPLIRVRAGGLPILELGCGAGDDTEVLWHNGAHVIAIDVSEEAIAKARTRVPAAEFYCRDMRAGFPSRAANLGVAVASLSLHYFPWDETLLLVKRIRDVLRRRGVLLCRLNSVKDIHHGAVGHPRIADDYYCVEGKAKRFFSRQSVGELFAQGWRIHAAEEKVTHKYAQPKYVWEVVAERAEAASERQLPATKIAISHYDK
jgi:SAM-dependent methyltransferase